MQFYQFYQFNQFYPNMFPYVSHFCETPGESAMVNRAVAGPGPGDARRGARPGPVGLQLVGGLRAQRHGAGDGLRVVHLGESKGLGCRNWPWKMDENW